MLLNDSILCDKAALCANALTQRFPTNYLVIIDRNQWNSRAELFLSDGHHKTD